MLIKFHRVLGAIVLAFLVLHIGNHIVGLFGLDVHLTYMEAVRPIYRNEYVEVFLVAAIAAQLCVGLGLALRSQRHRKPGVVGILQVLSGVVLVYFFTVHTWSTLSSRQTVGLDTNFYFAAAGLHRESTRAFFIGHYFLGVLALFTHLASALHFRLKNTSFASKANSVTFSVIAAGGALSALIVMSLAGGLYEVVVPDRYFVFFDAIKPR